MATLIQKRISPANIMLVGGAPSAGEVAAGQPFAGGAGNVLDTMLSRVGIGRHECFITNVCHEKPPEDKFEWFYKTANQLAYLRGVIQLKTDIETAQPNIIVAFGTHALKALTGKTGIAKWRGSVLPCTLAKGFKVLATHDPHDILRTWDYKGVAEYDLSKLQYERTTRTLSYPERTIFIPRGKVIRRVGTDWVTSIEPYNPDAIAEEMEAAPEVSVDIECIETSTGKWELDCVGFSDSPGRALVLDARVPSSLVLIRRLCKSPAKKIYQNGTFDITVLRNEGVEVTDFAWDTMLGHHALITECASGADEMTTGKKRQAAFAKGLSFLVSFYTREPNYKDDGKLWKETGDKDMFYRYNGLDAAVTFEIKQQQKGDIAEFGTQECADREFNLVEPLMTMTRRGLLINLAKREQIKQELTTEIDRLQEYLNGAAGFPVNVKSRIDVFKLAYDKLKLPERRNKKTGNVTADKDAIVYLADKYQHPMLLTILKIRERRDLIERYANAPIDADGRMRCSFDITGTRTGRLASRVSIYGSGTNLHTIPEDMRVMFESDPGKVFIYRDFSQAEARVVAALADDEYLLKLFADPSRDIHKETAAVIFGKPVDQITPEERFLGKKVRHAVNYGMDAGRFVEVVNQEADQTGIRISFSLARKVIDGFFMLHPNHKSVFWANAERQIRNARCLTTPFGRKRVFYGRWNDALIRDAYSFVPQSTIGDLCNEAIIQMYNRIITSSANEVFGAELMLAVHDSILVQCNIAHVVEVNKLMGDCMNIPFTVNGHTLTIPTDSKVGYNWSNAGKDGSNPRGLMPIEKWIESHEKA